MLALFVDVALVHALVRTKHGLPAAYVQTHEEVSAVVTEGERDVMRLEEIQILILLWHGFGRNVMTTHGYLLAGYLLTV